ncbi:carbon-nitrogen hydrolase family protein [Marinimicrobium alkaliphilum]|uniref:carbon-nitrogen hydrolase family protein n=1 Tax=Marinimicrobium alkaliphilum TaxID=2202654 RepID=UPI000DBA8FF5|nr:carbon-nitrogen hydrolase family protein [Marinimicrobium alkaliphilum]
MAQVSENKLQKAGSQLTVRNAVLQDVPAIVELSDRVYNPVGMEGYTHSAIVGQINNFPQGQIVVLVDETVVGYCATFRVSGDIALKPHTWNEITGNGYASRHDIHGDWLYGMEVCIDNAYRGYRIGQRLYNERKKLCQSFGLKGVVFAGRLPNLRKRIKKCKTVENYIDQVVHKKIKDPVLSFQLRNGFSVHGVIEGYLDDDLESMNCAAHMVWYNPKVPAEDDTPVKKYGVRMPDVVRIATVQYMLRKVTSFGEFIKNVEYFVDVVADYKSDFVVFPELFTLQLLSIEDQELSPFESIEALTKYTPAIKEVFRNMALKYNVNIIAGSHPTRVENGRIENISYIFLRDGRSFEQAKIHPTPNERYWWDIEGGSSVRAIDTDCGPIGVLICYDSEFPELARHLVDQGIQILFVPFCTDERQSYLRVRYCCQARAVENQIYVVMSGNVGNLPNVSNLDIQYAQSCILTPCDFPFARDGIAADTTPNVETVAFADLRPEALIGARNGGTVQNLKDRRHDLYQVLWKGDKRRRRRTPGSKSR